MAVRKTDQYPNRALIECTQSAANAITFEQIRFGVGLFQGIALILHKIHWFPTAASIREIVAATDLLAGMICNRDDLDDTNPTSMNNITSKQWLAQAYGTAGSGELEELPYVTDFTTMPGGGMIIPANPLYLAVSSAGFSAVGRINIVLFYTFISLKDAEYLELLQSLIPANI